MTRMVPPVRLDNRIAATARAEGDTGEAHGAKKDVMFIDSSDDDREDLDRLLDGGRADEPREDPDRLLDGGRADDARAVRLRRLSDLLGVASAPARPDELRGEGDALAAFQAARRAQPAGHRVPAARRVPVGSAAKVAAAVATALAMGGTAAAMAAGLVPNPLPDIVSPSTHASTGVSPSGRAARDRLRSPSAAPLPTAAASGASAATSPAGAGPAPASPQAAGATLATGDLCTLYLSLSESERPEALTEARFAPLVKVAGEPESVDAYCDQLLRSPSPTPSRTPSPTLTPSPSPTPSPSTEGSSSAAVQPPEPPSGSDPPSGPMSAGSTTPGPFTDDACVTGQRRPDEPCASAGEGSGESSRAVGGLKDGEGELAGIENY
jgi:hypothetical protein